MSEELIIDPPRCPTCGHVKDTIERDFDSGALEAACGDEWHERGADRTRSFARHVPGEGEARDVQQLSNTTEGSERVSDDPSFEHVADLLPEGAFPECAVRIVIGDERVPLGEYLRRHDTTADEASS